MTWRRLGLGALAALLTALTAHPVCHLVFRCGCAWVFAGGVDHCNIQVPGPPDCPVCTIRPVGALFAAALYGAWLGVLTLARRWAAGMAAPP